MALTRAYSLFQKIMAYSGINIDEPMLLSSGSILGFNPRRSLLFVSWDGGDFGNVGATEWLEVRTALRYYRQIDRRNADHVCL